MKYFYAYFLAFKDLFMASSFIYMLARIFWNIELLVGLYLFYLVVVASFGGVVKEMIKD